ncbi:hypothetical protein J6590_037078 [Homalodisca vitripennis]|nr:hypothetical protein J6590_037078 [Homalodisca vitripennis]
MSLLRQSKSHDVITQECKITDLARSGTDLARSVTDLARSVTNLARPVTDLDDLGFQGRPMTSALSRKNVSVKRPASRDTTVTTHTAVRDHLYVGARHAQEVVVCLFGVFASLILIKRMTRVIKQRVMRP